MKTKLLQVFFMILTVKLMSTNSNMTTVKEDSNFGFKFSQNQQLLMSKRDVPEYEFITNPFSLGYTHYDYMPGSYNSFPLRKQPEISQPNGFPAGGYYIAYHRQENATTNRRVFSSYIDAYDNFIIDGQIGTQNLWEGYPAIAIDPVTADPFFVWHSHYVNDYEYDVVMSFNAFHNSTNPNSWSYPLPIYENGNFENEFLWPIVEIDNLPYADKRRIYVCADNYGDNGQGWNQINNVIAYTDFEVDDLENPADLVWNYVINGQMVNNEERYNKAFAVKDNYVAVMGYKISNSEDCESDSLFVLINDNYGEGEFQYYSTIAEWEQPDYQLLDGSWLFGGNELVWKITWSNHMNLIFKDEHTLSFVGNLGLMILDDDDSWYYLPGLGQIYPKEFTYNLQTEEFGLTDLYPQGQNPHDNIPMVPWDLDEDGEIDSLDIDGYPLYTKSFPVFGTDPDNGFHYNLSHITKNEGNGWLAAVWSDAMKAYLAENTEDEYQTWNEKPELLISVSDDNGENWSEPIRMHANSNAADGNFVTQFQDMIPCYVYPCDKLEDLGNNKAKLSLFFLDDNSYGSSIMSDGEANGGELIYTSLEIDMDYNASGGEDVVEENKTKLYNYPNPFNPETTIYFKTLQIGKPAEIIIYNLKGQKVKSFKISNLKKRNSINWRGRDKQNKSVVTGIYFYQLIINKKIEEVNKMILMK